MKKFSKQYMTGTHQDQTVITTTTSFGTNSVIGLGKLVLATCLLSPWRIDHNIITKFLVWEASSEMVKETGQKRRPFSFFSPYETSNET